MANVSPRIEEFTRFFEQRQLADQQNARRTTADEELIPEFSDPPTTSNLDTIQQSPPVVPPRPKRHQRPYIESREPSPEYLARDFTLPPTPQDSNVGVSPQPRENLSSDVEIQTLIAEISGKGTEIQRLHEQLDIRNGEVKRLTERLQHAEEAYHEAVFDRERSRAEKQELEDQVNRLRRELGEKSTMQKNLQIELTETQRQFRDMSDLLRVCQDGRNEDARREHARRTEEERAAANQRREEEEKRRNEEAQRLATAEVQRRAEAERRREEEAQRLAAAENQRRLEEEQRRNEEEQRWNEETQRRLEEERRRNEEQRRNEEAQRLAAVRDEGRKEGRRGRKGSTITVVIEKSGSIVSRRKNVSVKSTRN